MVRKVLRRRSKKYGNSPQSSCPPKSGTECDICVRWSVAGVQHQSTGVKPPLKFFGRGIEVEGEKRRRQSKPSEDFMRVFRVTSCLGLPEAKVGLTESREADKKTTDDLGRGRRNKNCLCAPATSRL